MGDTTGSGHARDGAGTLEGVLVAERPRLVGLAYRITGSRLDAEDVVQEAWERARRADPDAVERPAAWLTTVVSRLALDHLRSMKRRRESYVGPWLAEPVLTTPPLVGGAQTPPTGDPADIADLAASLTLGFLRVLEALSPVERAVFVMADVFAVPFPDIGRAVDRSPDACRQIARRARARLRDHGRRHQRPPDADSVVDDLVAALRDADVDRVVSLLAPDVVMVNDGGPDVHAARRPVVGRHRVVRLVAGLVHRSADWSVHFERAEVNGEAGVVVHVGDTLYLVAAVAVADGQVTGVHSVLNPDKLAALAAGGAIV